MSPAHFWQKNETGGSVGGKEGRCINLFFWGYTTVELVRESQRLDDAATIILGSICTAIVLADILNACRRHAAKLRASAQVWESRPQAMLRR